MATLFVDKIDPQSGTALEIGSSGDTITIPSGATMVNNGTQTGFGGTNTPNFFAYKASSGQAISNATETIVVFDTEKFDTNNNFASNRFTPTTAGKYYLEAIITYPTSADHDDCAIRINKNGSNIASLNIAAFHYEGRQVSVIVEANGSGDYFEAIAYHNRGSSITLTHGDNGRGYFCGYKLIE